MNVSAILRFTAWYVFFFLTRHEACDESGKSSGVDCETSCSFGNEVVWLGASVLSSMRRMKSSRKTQWLRTAILTGSDCSPPHIHTPFLAHWLCWTVGKKTGQTYHLISNKLMTDTHTFHNRDTTAQLRMASQAKICHGLG